MGEHVDHTACCKYEKKKNNKIWFLSIQTPGRMTSLFLLLLLLHVLSFFNLQQNPNPGKRLILEIIS